MKMKLVAVSILGLMMTAPFAQADTVSLKTEMDKASYAIGVDLARNIKGKHIEINTDALTQGIKDGMGNSDLQMSDLEMKDSLNAFQKTMMAKATAMFEKIAQENQTNGRKFLQENAKKPGVMTAPTGFQYKIITEGTGKKPVSTDTVTVDYTGTTIEGTVFDSTEKSGQSATFPLQQVIPCWTQGLQLMRVGGTMELYCPSNLAYGARSVGDVIGPNETLKFTITLKAIEKGEKKKGK